jgi:hypothetical protein
VKILKPNQGDGNDPDDTVTANFTAKVGFNTPYAAYLHEGMRKDGSHVVKNWSEQGSGAKFLETKLIMFRDRYGRIMVEVIERELSRS